MTERDEKAGGKSAAATAGGTAGGGRGASHASTPGSLSSLGAEVVDLFYAQAFSPGGASDEPAICRAFSDMLLRHWDLCCIVTFLQSDDGELRESAIRTHPHLDAEKTLRASRLLAAATREANGECQAWLDREADDSCGAGLLGVRRALAEAELQAGAGVPIYAQGKMVGVLVAVTRLSTTLRAALRGVRFVAAPIVIAIGNARRAEAMRAQRERIEQLVEELRRRGSELEAANLELRRVGRYRSLFLRRMSHELRTPLTSILGFAEILLDHEDLSDAQRRFCEKIQASGLQLQSSLNHLVDLSRLEAGETELFLHEFPLRETLRESCAAVARLAQKQGARIEFAPPPDLGTVVSDEGKLRQVFYNFLAHAIARSPEGGRVAVRAEINAPSSFGVEIEDEGEPLADPARIFDPVDLDAPSERGTNMNELGLVIAHRLLGLLGGTVRLDTARARGLAVRLEVPALSVESMTHGR